MMGRDNTRRQGINRCLLSCRAVTNNSDRVKVLTAVPVPESPSAEPFVIPNTLAPEKSEVRSVPNYEDGSVGRGPPHLFQGSRDCRAVAGIGGDKISKRIAPRRTATAHQASLFPIKGRDKPMQAVRPLVTSVISSPLSARYPVPRATNPITRKAPR